METIIQFDTYADYTLENSSVCLIPLTHQHKASLAQVAKDESIWTFLTENGQSDEDFEAYFNNALVNRVQQMEYPYVILDKATAEIAGTTRLYAIDRQLRTIKIGHTWLGKKFRGSGINKNTKYLLFEFVFDVKKFVRVGFGVHGENVISQRALENIGCIPEGKLRDFLPASDGKRTDLHLYSLLASEWTNTVRQTLKNKINTNT